MIQIDLKGKNVLVTGGARGIGKGISKIFAKAGARVAINYNASAEKANRLVKEIVDNSGEAIAIKADIGRLYEVDRMVNQVIKKWGCLDILVNNAGITTVDSIDTLTPNVWDEIMKINIYGTYNCSHCVTSHMLELGEGVIINISSTGAITGGGGGPHYAASKAAMIGFTRNLSKDLGPRGIRVNAILPTIIESDFLLERYPNKDERDELVKQIPVGRIGLPEDVGYLAAFMASDLGSYMTGEVVTLDGGRTYK
ncbi:SDR family NAD(P)-dependent oxidoreductase [Anaerosalibacter massiliensis]|uniref:3-oxoacyl-ACP reductase FabG n=1 Tax=Anaerosalibacter massiliensis TaxID=1347392 RepID=A0A9X2S696_9FIRM|nr:3-oxoacyl-ACP reductase family protein [Anaerosalibacter massiliensis]MCR2045149.1 3-oxoacyl-ACP reductase FabG [Anaerosalibacter massiliensis]